MADVIVVERDAPRAGAWRVTLDDPQHANALGPDLVAQLAAALQRAFDADARAIVIRSSGNRFCAGSDLSDVEVATDAELRERFCALEDLLETIRRAPALTIAAVRGPAFGAGADLVASCDYRLGARDARFAFPGSRFGVVLGTRHLAGLVGAQRAREIVVEGKMVDAEAAMACGLLSSLCEDAALSARVDEILQGSESIDSTTLRALLRLTRDLPSERDRAELLQSTSREGLALRIRDHARRLRDERAARKMQRP